MNELRGEKIDIIKWTDSLEEFVANALSPAKVKTVNILEDEQTALVIVPDYQLSLAIGKEGQNARLAARLTGLRVDIKSESQMRQETEAAAAAEKGEDEAAPEDASAEAETGESAATEEASEPEQPDEAAEEGAAQEQPAS
jgi:N utilization substance protein A